MKNLLLIAIAIQLFSCTPTRKATGVGKVYESRTVLAEISEAYFAEVKTYSRYIDGRYVDLYEYLLTDVKNRVTYRINSDTTLRFLQGSTYTVVIRK